MTEFIGFLVLGLASVYVFVRLVRPIGPTGEKRWYAGGLVIAAGVYVAFGLVLGGPPLGYELGQLAVFSIIAVYGLRRSALLIGIGWLAHAFWDAAHWMPGLADHAPQWYQTTCLSFDVALAAYIAFKYRGLDSDRQPDDDPISASNLG